MRAFLKPVDIWKKSKSPSTSWTCSHCQAENSLASRTTCATCGKASSSTLSGQNAAVSEVECSVCTLLNPSSRSKCEACGSALPKPAMVTRSRETSMQPQPAIVTHTDSGDGFIVDPSSRSDRMKSIIQSEPVTTKKETPNKRVNLFETLSNIQRALDKPDPAVEEPSPPPAPVRPLLSSRSQQPLSALAAMKRNADPGPSASLGGAEPIAGRKSSVIPISANKLKEQNGLLSSISNGSTVPLPVPTSSGRISKTGGDVPTGVPPAATRPLPLNVHQTSTSADHHHTSDEIIVLDLDEDTDDGETETALFKRIPYQTSTAVFGGHRAPIAPPPQPHQQTNRSRGATRLENLSDDDDAEPAPAASRRITGHKRPNESVSRPETAVARTNKAARVTTDRIDDDESRSAEESDFGSLDDFIVDSDEDEDGESYTGSDTGSGSGSGSGSSSVSDTFLNSDEEAEVDAMYHRRDRRRSAPEEIIISDDDASVPRPPVQRRSRVNSGSSGAQRRTDAFVIDDDIDDDDDIVDRHTPVFDLTAGYVQHTRNDLNNATSSSGGRSEFRELRPTFPRISAHYWSVKQLFKEGCCAINFNLFTLDAGATNPNCIGIQRAVASKGVAGKPSLSLDESYAKRRAAKEAKEAKKRRASAARAAKRKRSSSGSSKRRSRRGASASSDDPSGGAAGAADGGEPAARRTSKKRSYSSKTRFSRRK